MANIPADLLYTPEHEYVRKTKDPAVVEIGITDYAQGELGDIVFVELPEPGAEVRQFGTFGVIESVKAVSDLYAPLKGSVTEINDRLAANPELVNSDPYGDGWMIRIRIADAADTEDLLDGPAYDDLVAAG